MWINEFFPNANEKYVINYIIIFFNITFAKEENRKIMDVISNLDKIKERVISYLKEHLPKELHYHSIDHTLDVFQESIRLAEAEGISEADKQLLLIAALFHDIGFIESLENHEERGCKIAARELPFFNISAEDLEKIQAAIMATKIPQTPTSQLGEILCDADLDYLGRSDFFVIGDRLFRELNETGKKLDLNQWNEIQINFLKQHHYFTKTNIRLREPQKLNHLAELNKKLSN